MKNKKRTRIRSKSHAPQNLILEEIIGLTTKNGNGLASSISSTKCAYIAGCVVVLYDVLSGTQSHLTAPNRVLKPLSCVALSYDSRVVAAGESGHQPAVLVWDCATVAFICELKCHSYGVACMALSADGKYLVSTGFPRDGYICLWDWQNKLLVAKVKSSSVSNHISSIEFTLNNKFIITAEKNELKIWKVRWPPGSRASTRSVSLTMLRKVDLGPKELSFVAVTSPRWMCRSSVNHTQTVEQTPIYAVTEKGTLCMVYPGSSIIKTVELEVEKCFAISISTSLVACACNNGLVKLFGINSLEHSGGLCYVESKRCKESNVVNLNGDPRPTLPDAIACQFSTSEKLVVVYDDHSLCIWNIHDIDKATRCCVLVSHSGCIWDIKNVPCENMHDHSLSCVAKGCSGGLSFATCSADGNIRLWDLALQSAFSKNSLSVHTDDSSNGDMCLVSAGIFERLSVAEDISSFGFRAMAVSSDGQLLAAGDSQGNIHIFNLYTSDYIFIQDAHGAEILSLCFNLPDRNSFTSDDASKRRHFLASGGRDGKINLFDVDRSFNLCGSINYHSSAVTVVKVAQSGREVLSCAADRSMALHIVNMKETECKFSCIRKIATPGIIYDVAVDHPMDVALTVGQEKKINTFDIQSGKLIRWFQHDGGGGDPIKVATDGTHSYLACSYSNRCICIYDYVTGEMVAQATGHSELVTGVIFLSDCKHLVSVGADGCIFVWKLPALLSSRMLQKIKDISVELPPENMHHHMYNQVKSDLVPNHKPLVDENLNQSHTKMFFQDGSNTENAGFKFSISRLPKWAQSQVSNSSSQVEIDSTSSKIGLPQDYACPELQSPSEDNSGVVPQFSGTLSKGLSETESNQLSPSPPKTERLESNNRWLTIHTVCMDMLYSPESCEMKSFNVQGSAIDSRCTAHGPVSETYHPNKRFKLSPVDPSNDDPQAEPNNVHRENGDFNLHDDVDASGEDSQGNEFFKINFGGLSAELKTEEQKSLSRSNYTSRFLVRREVLQGRKRFLCTHAQYSVDGSSRETDSNVSSPKAAGNAQPSSFRQSDDTPTIDSSGSPLHAKVVKIRDEEAGALDVEKSREEDNVRSCEEVLHNLETAAEKALQLFCRLETVNLGDEKSKSLRSQLYANGAKIIPSIEKKLQAIAKLLQPSSSFQRDE